MSFKQPAPAGEIFTADAFDSQIGKQLPVNIEGSEPKTGRLIAAQVADDGQSVELTIDVDLQVPTPAGRAPVGYGAAFGFR